MTINPKTNMFINSYIKDYQVFLPIAFLFEIKSFVGRILLNKKPPKQKHYQFLNLGSGNSIVKGWVNADMYDGFIPWNKKRIKYNWMQDFRYPLKCPSNYWDGVFTEHTLEHLHPWEAFNLLKELYRTLKPNAFIRITTPDLEKYVNFYEGKESRIFRKKFVLGSMGIWSLTQNWGHKSVWDYKTLDFLLKCLGFRNIVKVEFGRGSDGRIIKDNKDRNWETLYVEAQK